MEQKITTAGTLSGLFREREELLVYEYADRVASEIPAVGVAATIAEPTGDRVVRTGLELATEHIDTIIH